MFIFVTSQDKRRKWFTIIQKQEILCSKYGILLIFSEPIIYTYLYAPSITKNIATCVRQQAKIEKSGGEHANHFSKAIYR